MEDLGALLNSARSLNAHIGRPDRPAINKNLEQIESDTRNLISRLPGTDQEGRAYDKSLIYYSTMLITASL